MENSETLSSILYTYLICTKRKHNHTISRNTKSSRSACFKLLIIRDFWLLSTIHGNIGLKMILSLLTDVQNGLPIDL